MTVKTAVAAGTVEAVLRVVSSSDSRGSSDSRDGIDSSGSSDGR